MLSVFAALVSLIACGDDGSAPQDDGGSSAGGAQDAAGSGGDRDAGGAQDAAGAGGDPDAGGAQGAAGAGGDPDAGAATGAGGTADTRDAGGGAAAGSGGDADASLNPTTASGGSGPADANVDGLVGADAAPVDGGSDGAGGHSTANVDCGPVAPIATGTCAVTSGDAGRVIVGTVLTPNTIYRGGEVVVDGQGRIVFVGCKTDCAADAACAAVAGTATAITCPTGVISPGLINTHDHLTYAHNGPYINTTGERWEHRHDWRKGLDGHTKIPAPGGATSDQISWGELRFLFGGATSTVGSGGQTGILRNLDQATMQEGLGQPQVEIDTFPLNDSTPPTGYPSALACTGFSGAVTTADIAADDAYLPHVSEGVNAYAEDEFACLSTAPNDVLATKSAFVNAVGLSARDYRDMAASGTSLIWSPRSNVSLYGNTSDVTTAARLGIRIALGTDWVLSGSMNLLRELRCADSLNRSYYGKFFTDRDLWLMTTLNAAQVTAVDDVLGTLAAGKIADISIWDGSHHADYRAVIDAAPSDVVLVMRAGKVLYGDQAVVSGMSDAGACDTLDVCGVSKQVCLQGEIGKTYEALQSSVGDTYAAFFCADPTDEPSCVPSRPASVNGSTVYTGAIVAGVDSDGDGIADAQDDCPTVFNPVRPVDRGAQPDFDHDGLGDACDPCPLSAGTTQCATFGSGDRDGDGVPNATDNCPEVANADQKDTDGDSRGDACDACPLVANPGNQACPATIYQVKDGTMSVGTAISLTNQLVTGRNDQGYFLQVKPGDPDWSSTKGADNSGIYVGDSANTVKVGDRVTLSTATVTSPSGRIELTAPTAVVVTSLAESSPAPVVVLPGDVATGGSRAAALESVLVEVDNVSVTRVAQLADGGTAASQNDFIVGGSLCVSDYLYRIEPAPVVGQSYDSLVGILEFRGGESKLEVRGDGDAVGPPALIGFSPALSFTDVGQADSPTFPAALTVTLSKAPAADTFVPVTSGTPAHLTVTGGGVTVLAGQTTAEVLVSGLAQDPSVTLSATLGQSMQAAVRVVGPAEQPAIASLTPVSPVSQPGSKVTFTVLLDIPAVSGGTTVALAVIPASAGTVPATVVVPSNQLSTTFEYVDAAKVSSATISATLGASTASSTITLQLSLGSGLLINEVDYDQPGTDDAEYVEIYNGGSIAQPLAGLHLVFINGGNNGTYQDVDLSSAGTLPVGGYLVVGATSVVSALPEGALKVDLGAVSNDIQNGAPDGLALIDATNHTLLDVLSYEGSITSATISGLTAPQSLVEGTALPASVADSNTVVGSLCRMPNGTDSHDASADWKFCSALTPGASNQL